ncbi:glycoside hydrolase, partial [uncultured Alistipes sp.]|uniref:alpha-L-rhamnosidase-related protein n=1 Tax=uncultured Alistipes sp. TaxID=538949 RepID=UPI00261A15EF
MKRFLLLEMALVFAVQITIGQPVLPGYRQSSVAPELMAAPWSARWISVPGASPDAYGVYHFRKAFELAKCPRHFAVHVSADNRYKLYVNGVLAAQGPSRCDGAHWNYETVDLAPWLHAGRNAVTAVVWNYADLKPAAQITLGETGFLMQGATERERIVDTDSSWRCIKNDAYAPLAVTGLRGYYVAGPGEMLTAARYPWGWTEPDFDDSNWHTASCGALGRPKGAARSGERQLVPSPVPMSERIPMRFAQVVLAEGVKLPKGFPAKPAVLVVPAHTRAVLLLDQGEETTGYLRLSFSGGHGAVIAAGYAEALYTGAEGYDKGDRNDPTGKLFLGYEDRIVADGGPGRTFEPLWWRTWRYVRLTVETQDEPLSLDDVSGVFSAYPFRLVSRFSAPERPELERMLNVGWRTARLCANETYMDCPYYEQMQYFGDARIQALITLYNTRDTCMVRQLLDLCRQSMLPEGIPQSRYPSDLPQVIPPFAVWWLGTAYDYWMMRGDEAYLQTLLPAFRRVLGWFERYRGTDGLLHDVPYWFFIDWPEEFDFGQPRRSADGTSAYQDVVYL